ncbi:MAG: sigma-70 family RNA polymerase sigma factor [bacterium]|nr:sigma-70 family RNA polymerase sigma factor [bacterium]
MWESSEEKKEAFKVEALTHIDTLYNAALKFTSNKDDAKDLVQETFYKAYKFFGNYEPGTSCKAWLFKILKNSFINSYRRKVRQPEKVDFDTVEPFVDLIRDKSLVSMESLDESIFNSHMSDDVRDALAKLPDEFRMVMVLSDVEGFSYKEISDIMDCPIGTVRSRLSRGRKLMYRYLLKYAKAEGY